MTTAKPSIRGLIASRPELARCDEDAVIATIIALVRMYHDAMIDQGVDLSTADRVGVKVVERIRGV